MTVSCRATTNVEVNRGVVNLTAGRWSLIGSDGEHHTSVGPRCELAGKARASTSGGFISGSSWGRSGAQPRSLEGRSPGHPFGAAEFGFGRDTVRPARFAEPDLAVPSGSRATGACRCGAARLRSLADAVRIRSGWPCPAPPRRSPRFSSNSELSERRPYFGATSPPLQTSGPFSRPSCSTLAVQSGMTVELPHTHSQGLPLRRRPRPRVAKPAPPPCFGRSTCRRPRWAASASACATTCCPRRSCRSHSRSDVGFVILREPIHEFVMSASLETPCMER